MEWFFPLSRIKCSATLEKLKTDTIHSEIQ